MRRSLRGARVGAVTDRRRLIVMRHAKAEPFAPSDHARALTDKGLASARDAGAHVRDTGVTPDYAVVSSAVRTRQTWDALVETAGITGCEVSFDDAVFTGSAEVALEVLQAVPEDADTVLFLGHNPTAAFLAHYLDDGEGDPDAVSEMLHGFPPGAVAVLEVTVPWSDLGSETGTVTDFYVGQP
jgi:phosphohistidine phosphatase